VLIGLGFTCAALGWLAFRVSRQMRGIYEAQQSATAQLTDSLSARNVFIADASHELRTPLTVLKGNAELSLVIDHKCEHDEILLEIVAESDRMTRLVENLLFLARSDGATIPLKVETFSAEVLGPGSDARAEMLVQEHGGEFIARLAGTGTVTADKGQIEQAVMILVDNAAKYSRAEGRVALRTFTANDQFVIEVEDNGPGIPPADLPHIFERFYRVDNARSRCLGGVGLGLSIATTIVEAHSGSLEVDNRVGEGTRGCGSSCRSAPHRPRCGPRRRRPAPSGRRPCPRANAAEAMAHRSQAVARARHHSTAPCPRRPRRRTRYHTPHPVRRRRLARRAGARPRSSPAR
jgi:signal transduction histidine kinase